MAVIEFGRRRIFILIASIGVLFLLFNVLSLTGDDVSTRVSNLHLPGRPTPTFISKHEDSTEPEAEDEETSELVEVDIPDSHPIHELRLKADQKWREYESQRSRTFRQTEISQQIWETSSSSFRQVVQVCTSKECVPYRRFRAAYG